MWWPRRKGTPRGGAQGRFSKRQRTLAALVAAFVAAGIGYAGWIVGQRTNPAALSRLVVETSPSGFEPKAAQRAPVPSSQVIFKEEKTAVEHTPGRAGEFSVTWKGDRAHKNAIAELLVTLAPTNAAATTVRTQADSQYLNTKTLAADGYTVTGSVSVPGVPGAEGVTLSSSSSTLKTAAVVFRVGRAVVVEFLEEGGAPPTAPTVHLALSEYRLLVPASPGFTLVQTTYPFVASLAYWGAAVGIVAIALVAPPLVGRARRRRRARMEQAHRRERLSRGRKVITRRAGPRRATARARR